MKVKDLIKLFKDDGWYEVKSKGSHRQFKHDTKKGRVTVSDHGRNSDIPKGTLNSILKQAGLKDQDKEENEEKKNEEIQGK